MKIARAGFIAYVAVIVVGFALDRYEQSLWGALRLDFNSSSSVDSKAIFDKLAMVRYLELGLGALNAGAFFAIGRAPPAARVARLATAIAAVMVLELGMSAAHILTPSRSIGTESMELYITVTNVGYLVTSLTIGVCFALLVLRLGRAAKSKLATGVVVAIGVIVAVRVIVRIASLTKILPPSLSFVTTVLYYGSTLVWLAVALLMAVIIERVEQPERVAPRSDLPALDPAWANVAGGITIYLFAVGARILCAGLAFAAMRGASGADSFTELKRVGDNVLTVGVLSGIIGLGALTGVFRIGRGPSTTGAHVPANTALFLMIIGMLLDAVTTKVSVDAFSSVSGAFFAQDALPVFAGIGTGLGVAAGASLLSAFRMNAQALGLMEVAARATSTAKVLIVAGIAAAGLQLAVRGIPFELFVLVAVLVLPAMLFVAVRFIAIALAIAREINARLATTQPMT